MNGIITRILFEITYFFALLIMLPFNFFMAVLYLIYEVGRVYPRELYDAVYRFYYGNEQ
jgi:hypothetical protein